MSKREAVVLAWAVRRARKDELAALSDCELLRRYAESADQAAFAALAGRHTAMVLGVCKRALGSEQDAENACQAVFLVLAKKAKANRWQSSVANWLYATARKVARNARVASERRARREGKAAVPEAVAPADTLSGRELMELLDEELEKLPPRYREPLVLCYLEGLTRDEAAARLGVAAGALKGQLERGRKKLADALTARGCTLGVALLVTAATSSAGASPPRLASLILAAVGGTPSASVAALAQGVAVNGILSHAKWAMLAVAGVALLGFGFSPGAKTPQVGQAAEAKRDAPAPDAKARVITGQVLGADGGPAGGVKLFHSVMTSPNPVSTADIAVSDVGQTDAAGRFRVTLGRKSSREYLIAHKPGFGIDWVELDAAGAKKVSLRLVPDVAIRGRVVTTEGKPAAGVSVSVVSVHAPPDGKLDGYLAAWKVDQGGAVVTLKKQLYCPLGAVTGSARTDADGRFTLAGVGADRIAHLVAEGAGTARQSPMVITRAGFDPKPYNNQVNENRQANLQILLRFPLLNGPDLTLIAERGKTLVGTLTDALTGKPVAGVNVSVSTGWDGGLTARTGADGKYRLEGVTKEAKGYALSATPSPGAGYLTASATAADTVGFASVRHDIRLVKGVVVTGRVTDRQSGKGVRAGVRLVPLPGNKFFGSVAGFDSYRRDRRLVPTDTDGRFRLTTIPGRSLLMVQARDGGKFNGEPLNPFRRAVPDLAHEDLFKYEADDDSWIVTAADGSVEFLNTEQAVRVLDVKDSGETIAEVTVDRGRTGRVEVRDADGKPLAGAIVAGLADSWPLTYKLPGSAATVYALDPAKPRTLAVYHPAKNLGGVVTIRGDEKDPIVVRLSPAGRVTGRFMDEDGAPLAGAEVTVNAGRQVFSELYRFTARERPRTVTDAAGKFALPGIVPGMEFSVQIRKGEQFYGGKPKIGRLNLKTGEMKALGDHGVERLR